MSKVDDPSLLPVVPIEALHHILDDLSNGLVRPVKDTGVGVALDSNGPVADSLEHFGRVVEPVKADDVVSQVASGVQRIPCALGEDDHGHGVQTHLFELGGQMLGDVGQVGLGELLEGSRGELSGPRVKDLDQLRK